MLGYYIRDRKRLAAMERSPLGPFLKEAANGYYAEGYYYKYVQHVLGYVTRFGDWLRTHQVPLERVTEEHVDGFVHWIVPRPPEKFIHTKRRALAAAYRVLALIRAKHPLVLAESPVQMEVSRYVEHLRRNRGLAEGTLEHHQRNLEQFLTFCFKQRRVNYSAITAARIHAYVDGLPNGRSNSRRRGTCVALRGYFQFLQLQGVPTGRLRTVVPIVRSPRVALSPKWLTPADADQLLRSIDRSRASGKRNYAAILCMIDLGLRVGDVARLSLDDIDWHEGTIRVPNHKRARPYRLPLPKRLGRALANYLTKGRPSSQRREVFLFHAHPRGIPINASALKTMVRRVWQRAGLDKRFSGTHILRHSLATRMKQEGVSLKFIADVLGHHSLQTTTLYAQVDLPALRAVAQPWPEGQP
jgi:site-specific recombinase XerD